ncbi:MAG: hypothetical protein IKZ82_05760 [Clostridia bacterium]|nr:hypothetical protein [Clostridia bacterium]MBR5948137.1 hypothetical protein [Clostridia bacterium]
MKKFVSLLLVAVLCIAVLPLQAFAAVSDEHVDEPKGHTHVIRPQDIVTKPLNTYVHHDDTNHKMVYVNSVKCKECGALLTWNSYGAPVLHDRISVYSASCDGTWQKHYGTCLTCNGYGYKRVKCPAGPHTGACPYLPV